jgi:hypothetical protein
LVAGDIPAAAGIANGWADECRGTALPLMVIALQHFFVCGALISTLAGDRLLRQQQCRAKVIAG